MPVSMQGPWTVEVHSKSASFGQRFRIQGSSNGVDGVYNGVVSTPPVHVTGSQWSITVQNDQGTGTWVNSAERVGTPSSSAGQITFDLRSDDGGGAGDADYNDLVLRCRTTASDSAFIIYGRVRTYAGRCRFNPCFPFPYLVVDSALVLERALADSTMRPALEALYPERIRKYVKLRKFPKPIPEPDPPPFRAMMIPLAEMEGVSILASQKARTTAVKHDGGHEHGESEPIAARMKTLGANTVERYATSVLDLAKLRDSLRIFPICTVTPRPGVLLRFLEYDRTAAELVGGPYSGEGDRQPLGFTVTDELGNYIFFFSRTFADLGDEASDIPTGVPAATGLRPDVIVQVVAGIGLTPTVLWESGLYADIANLRRIDICIPDDVLRHGTDACLGTRPIQAIGNIFTITGVGTTFDAVGRVTATNSNGPLIQRGAWGGRLHMFACFLGLPQVRTYTIRYRRPGFGWSFVQEAYTHINKAAIGFPNSPLHKVGPFDTPLHVDGGPLVTVPAYNNIEADSNWVETHRLRKVILSSQSYITAVYAVEGAGSIDFRVEGYDAAGTKVPGADDTIRLFIDNRPMDGDIASITKGGSAPTECALFDLAAPDEPLTVRFKVDQPGGFLESYGLSVFRGSADPVAVQDSTPPLEPVAVSYHEPTHGSHFFGTANSSAADASGFVTVDIEPTSGSWLPAGHNFCAFMVQVSGDSRVTDGYVNFGGGTLDFELIGISE